MHPKLSKVQDLAAVESELADVERDLDILKQRLPPRLREKFDNISIDMKELNNIKQRVQAEKQRRARRTR